MAKNFLKISGWTLLGLGGLVALLVYRPRYLRRLISTSQPQNGVLYHIDTDQKVVALTIDDGPHPTITPQILDILDLYEVPATFFLLGNKIAGHEELVRQMVCAGHEIGNHMLDDQRSIFLPAAEFDRQIEGAHALLSELGPVNWYRPGSGLYDQRMLTAATQLGYKVVLGSVYPYDAQIPGHIEATQIVSSYVIANTTPGAIIVLHDGEDERARIVEVLTEIIPQLKADGYQFVTLSELATYGVVLGEKEGER